MIALHLSLIALIMIGSGVVAVLIGAVMAMSFDASSWMPAVGVPLAYLGAAAVVIGLGVQVGAWIYA